MNAVSKHETFQNLKSRESENLEKNVSKTQPYISQKFSSTCFDLIFNRIHACSSLTHRKIVLPF